MISSPLVIESGAMTRGPQARTETPGVLRYLDSRPGSPSSDTPATIPPRQAPTPGHAIRQHDPLFPRTVTAGQDRAIHGGCMFSLVPELGSTDNRHHRSRGAAPAPQEVRMTEGGDDPGGDDEGGGGGGGLVGRRVGSRMVVEWLSPVTYCGRRETRRRSVRNRVEKGEDAGY